MSTSDPHPLAIKLFGVAAIIGVGGWLTLLAVYTWWMLQPANIPTVTEPMPILNENHEVAIGEPLLVELQVSKFQDLTPVGTTRYLACDSSNLVTLTKLEPIDLPIGEYTVISDDIVVPAKITPGDMCRAIITVSYRINPVRVEGADFESDKFTVLAPRER